MRPQQQHPQRQQQRDQVAVLHDIVGGQALMWLEESRVHQQNIVEGGEEIHGYTLFRGATFTCLIMVLLLWWGRRRYSLRHCHHQQQQQSYERGGDMEEVIFILGMPLLMQHRRTTIEQRNDTVPRNELGQV